MGTTKEKTQLKVHIPVIIARKIREAARDHGFTLSKTIEIAILDYLDTYSIKMQDVPEIVKERRLQLEMETYTEERLFYQKRKKIFDRQCSINYYDEYYIMNHVDKLVRLFIKKASVGMSFTDCHLRYRDIIDNIKSCGFWDESDKLNKNYEFMYQDLNAFVLMFGQRIFFINKDAARVMLEKNPPIEWKNALMSQQEEKNRQMIKNEKNSKNDERQKRRLVARFSKDISETYADADDKEECETEQIEPS